MFLISSHLFVCPMRLHDAMLDQGLYVVSGCVGRNADVVVWDLSNKTLIFRSEATKRKERKGKEREEGEEKDECRS